MKNKKVIIYCAGAIRGDTSYRDAYLRIIKTAEKFSVVKTEFSEFVSHIPKYLKEDKKIKIYERDKYWLDHSNALIAECSGSSTGVGYEICYANFVRKIPSLCLYSKDSNCSLIIIQNKEKYIIPQAYNNIRELELFVEGFIKIVSNIHSKYVKDAFKKFVKFIRNEKNNITNINLDIIINKLIEEYKLCSDVFSFNYDFKDKNFLLNFILRSFVIQKRWINLKSQRLGNSFISGKKDSIISSIATLKDDIFDLNTVYYKLDLSKLPYTKRAFTKNLRAYRLIGLLISPYKFGYGSTKIKREIHILKTLDNKIEIFSKIPRIKKINGLVKKTNYLKHLYVFISKFKKDALLNILFKNQEILRILPNFNKMYNIDDINIEFLIKEASSHELLKILNKICDEFYNKYFSSNYMK